MKNLYYTAPSNKVFDEVKKEAIKLWKQYEEPYKSEKINRIINLCNVQDNMMYIVAMFDDQNQAKLAKNISNSTKEAIAQRLRAGGMSDAYNKFL